MLRTVAALFVLLPWLHTFIFAKSVDAPGIPLAVYRNVVGAWPVQFTLDESQAMMPGRNLSSVARVTLEAGISSSGQALAASGDLSGTRRTIDPSAREPLKILIDRVIP
jgi:cytochrome c-type biogenesis protein CcmH